MQSCQDDFKDVDVTGWALSDSQENDGVVFTLTVCNDEFVPCNDFIEGENVRFLLTATNNRTGDVGYRSYEWDDLSNFKVMDDEGKTVFGKYASPKIDYSMEYVCSMSPGETSPIVGSNMQPDTFVRNMNEFCWAGSPETDPKYHWDKSETAKKGIYTGVLSLRTTVYDADGELLKEPLFDTSLDLQVRFVVRGK